MNPTIQVRRLLFNSRALGRIGGSGASYDFPFDLYSFRPVGSINPKQMSLAQITVLEKQRARLLTERRLIDRSAQRQASVLGKGVL